MGQFTVLLMVLGVFSLSLIAASTSKAFVNTIDVSDRPDEVYVGVVESNVVKSGDRRETDASGAAVAMTDEIDEHSTTQAPEAMPTKSPSNSPSNTPSSSPSHSAARKPREGAAKLPPPPLLSYYDWTNMTVYSDQAKAIYAHQHNCSIPWIRYDLRKLAMGLGSELHVWSYVLNESMRFRGYRVLTHVPPRDPHRPRHEPSWDWLDHKACGDPFHNSQLDC
jgi:hypothetical protein